MACIQCAVPEEKLDISKYGRKQLIKAFFYRSHPVVLCYMI